MTNFAMDTIFGKLRDKLFLLLGQTITYGICHLICVKIKETLKQLQMILLKVLGSKMKPPCLFHKRKKMPN